MSKDIRLKKGVDIRLAGQAPLLTKDAPKSSTYVVKPTDFLGIRPKLAVKEGQEVKAGTPLFYSKDDERIKFCAPVSGEVAEIVRGDKRKLLQIKILADKENSFEAFEKIDSSTLNKETVTARMLEAGLWPFMRQRPYGVIAKPEDMPKSIFISGFDSAPIAQDNNFILKDKVADFQAGVDILKHLTEGKIHLNLSTKPQSPNVLLDIKNVETSFFSGPHPAGNVGVQIHHISPLNKGDKIWYLYPQDVVAIGRLFNEGKHDVRRTIAVAGSMAQERGYYDVHIGYDMNTLLEGKLQEGDARIISGNVLTGSNITSSPYLGFYDTLVCALPEGNEGQFLGWIAPNLDKFSISRALFSWLQPNKVYDLDTNMRGEERAYVVTGQYEQVLPMDILPVQLLKSIMIEDIDMMEKLGIYEVIEEDLALCEVVCTSKIPVQETLRKGLDLVRAELD